MNSIKKLLLMAFAIAHLMPSFGQNDTLTADGLYLKYTSPFYRSKTEIRVPGEIGKKIKNEDSPIQQYNDSEMVRGDLAKQTKTMDLTYKILPQYTISEGFGLRYPPVNPVELRITTNSVLASQWVHEDGECILFIKCSGERPTMEGRERKPDKSAYGLWDNVFNWIKPKVNITPKTLKSITEEEIQEVKKKITIWPSKKAKKTFNAHYVITYPINSEKSVFMDKYTHTFDLMMIKWKEYLTVSFLVTEKGNKNIKKYIKEVEEAFWFKD